MAAGTKKPTILYIDDSTLEREIVCRLLEADGCEVVSTGSPEAGVELACRVVPDLVLLDLYMPGMDGLAVVERLREEPSLQSVPVVAMSASINEDEWEEVNASFDGFVKKPVNMDVFPAEVREFIARGREEAPAHGEAEPGKKKSAAAAPEDSREALEALERIRSSLSHDLRSPLTVMISYAGTVGRGKAGELSERQKEMLDLVVEQGFEMDKLIAELARLAGEVLERYGYPGPSKGDE